MKKIPKQPQTAPVRTHPRVEGIHDFLNSATREELIHTALAVDKYMKDKSGKHLLGGLDDYIHKLDDNEIKEEIYKRLKECKEIKTLQELNDILDHKN